MADIHEENLLKSAQEHMPMCEEHGLRIDMTCETCNKFICCKCAKTTHGDHDWNTIATTGSLKKREIKNIICKMNDDVKKMEGKIQKVNKQIEDNQEKLDCEISNLQIHYEMILSKLNGIKSNNEMILQNKLETINGELSRTKSDIEKKKEQASELLKFVEEKYRTMSEYSLIDNLRDLVKLVSNTNNDKEKTIFAARYKEGQINETLLKSMMGQISDLEDMS